MSGPAGHLAPHQRGALLIEVLVAVLICAFGLLGFTAMQARATTSEFESFQRSQALPLVEDMATRINVNRANAAAYVTNGLIGAGPAADCSGLAGASLDVCEWGNLLRGSPRPRWQRRRCDACGARLHHPPAGSTDRISSRSSGGHVADAGGGDACRPGRRDLSHRGTATHGLDPACVALLRDPASAPAVSRC